MTRRAVCAALAAACAAGASAQDARFLEPASATAPLGSAIELRIAEAGGAVAWPGERVGHFFARTAWTQENRDTLDAGGTGLAASWPADRPGVMVLGLDLEPTVETIPADAFGAFLDRAVPAPRRASLGRLEAAEDVRVRRVESAKALVRVSSEGPAPVSLATSKTGQAVEIRPLFDPTAIRPGGDLPVRVYASIPGPAEGLVLGANTTTGETIAAATGEDSTAHLTIPSAGSWRLEFHAVSPLDGGEAAWLVHTATLSFEVEDGPGAEAAGEVAR